MALIGAPCNRLLAACFASGTLLRTPGGLQPIETLRAGERVLSRDEHDPRGGPDYKVVEEVFERLGMVWHLTAGGRLIRTTGEHPFCELTRGWTPCRELNVGDRLLCEDGTTAVVEEVVDTGAVEVVYNLRVADWHTYFVGGQDWGFSVWAHNIACAEVDQIIRKVFDEEGLTPNGMNRRQGGEKAGNRAEWASRVYLVQYLAAKIGQLYPGQYQPADVQQVAEVAATRMLQAARPNDNPQTATFKPQHHETFRPNASLAVPPALSAIAHRRYTLTRSTLSGTQTFTPVSVSLNDGGWDVQLAAAIGAGKVSGIYILRSPNGAIYKVGKATDLVGRMERYASDWAASGVQVRAEIYAMPRLGSRTLLDPEMVLRGQAREDGWDLSPAAGAADGDFPDVRDSGFGGWTANPLS